MSEKLTVPRLPTIVFKSRHPMTGKQISALKYLYGGPIDIIADRNRFRSDSDDTEIIAYIKAMNKRGVMVYITSYGLSTVLAFAAGCQFGTFERFENCSDFELRAITHYNCTEGIVRVLYYRNRLSRVPILPNLSLLPQAVS